MEHHSRALVPGRVRGHREEQETDCCHGRWYGGGGKQTGQQVRCVEGDEDLYQADC